MPHVSKPLITLKQVVFSYDKAPPVLSSQDYVFPAHSFSLIQGPSGAGKSSLLRLLCRLEQPQKGTIFFHHQDISTLPVTELRRKMCFIQQVPVMVDGTVRTNLLLPFQFATNHLLRKPDDALLASFLDQFGLGSIPLNRSAHDLSIGQKQRVGLIRGMLVEPEVLLLDEPTSALDKQNRDIFLEIITRLYEEQKVTVILVSHEESLLEQSYVNHIFLDQGVLQ